MPKNDRMLKVERKVQSIDIVKASPKKNPVSDLKAMMIKEVPTATFMSILANRTKAGMIKNPPPAPMSPVTPPTKNPSIKING